MYHYKGTLKVGQINRFSIEVDHDDLPDTVDGDSLAIRVKNTTSALMRPAYLSGPYILYMSIREQSYRHDSALGEGDFAPHFDANVKTNCSRWQSIPITPPADSKLRNRTFEVDVESQIVFSPSAETHFEFTIGRNKHEVRHAVKGGRLINATTSGFRVEMLDTEALWSMSPVPRDHPGHHISPEQAEAIAPIFKYDADGHPYDHLVVLTHGIHSNLTTDLLYVKERIEATARSNGERVICKGFAGNVCNTERGVKWLAENVGEWVLRETGWKCNNGHAMRMTNPYKKISFIAHSLGGLVQIYVLGYLHDKTRGRIFHAKEGGLEPINFVTLATPWLGISAENPAYIKFALDFGLVGKTGQDLGLTLKPLGEYKVYGTEDKLPRTIKSRAPLLSLLSGKSSPSHIAIRLFARRTIYANIENDGIVPLRTSSLFFLDWEGFSAEKARAQKQVEDRNQSSNGKGQRHHQEHQDVHSMDGADDTPDKPSEQSSRTDHKTLQSSVDLQDAAADEIYRSEDSSDEDLPTSKSLGETNSNEELAHKFSNNQIVDSGDSRPNTAQNAEENPHFSPPVTPAKALPRASVSRDKEAQNGPQYSVDAEPSSPFSNDDHQSKSKFRSVAHALNFASMIRRVSQNRIASNSSSHGAHENSTQDPDQPSSPVEDRHHFTSPAKVSSSLISGPSDDVENASHSNGGLLGLLKGGGQSNKKPSKAFARSQTIPTQNTEGQDQVSPEEPSRTSFFKSLESVLNPPMPALDYIIDPSSREPIETVIVHDKYYYPKDIPPLKELPRKAIDKTGQSHSAKREEERERVLLEKVKLEERIARGWHEDMAWRKVLVKLRPDAHNNIIVRRAFANSYGWKVIDHLTEHHFGESAKENLALHSCGREKEEDEGDDDESEGNRRLANDEWDRASLMVDNTSSETEE